jgi:hypothetical protein
MNELLAHLHARIRAQQPPGTDIHAVHRQRQKTATRTTRTTLLLTQKGHLQPSLVSYNRPPFLAVPVMDSRGRIDVLVSQFLAKYPWTETALLLSLLSVDARRSWHNSACHYPVRADGRGVRCRSPTSALADQRQQHASSRSTKTPTERDCLAS